MTFLKNKSILITGGTGSFGKAFCKEILSNYKDINRIIIYSRDEFKQFEMEKIFPMSKYKSIRYFLGDVRDQSRLSMAMEGIDIVIHAAALKQVDKAEYNPLEYIKTNIGGAQNIIESAIANNVSNIIALSTDKASSPINLYGATKLCSDKLFLSANNIKGKKKIKFSVVRYGNVMGSRGSVLPFFLKQKEILPITDIRMTRFNISLDKSVDMVIWALKNNLGGEIFVPKIASFKVIDLAKATNNKAKIKIIGIRPGEKIHEELISEYDGIKTVDLDKYYAILNNFTDKEINLYVKKTKGKKIKEGFTYNSFNNPRYLSVQELIKEVKEFRSDK
tara:strand:- start:11244 stop:12245 length:1002 start_codon:yes stop_codon:yes gene_type:complete